MFGVSSNNPPEPQTSTPQNVREMELIQKTVVFCMNNMASMIKNVVKEAMDEYFEDHPVKKQVAEGIAEANNALKKDRDYWRVTLLYVGLNM